MATYFPLFIGRYNFLNNLAITFFMEILFYRNNGEVQKCSADKNDVMLKRNCAYQISEL